MKNTAPNTTASLRRTLGLCDLVLYGVIVIQPTAPLPIYGILTVRSGGYAATAILLALIAMLFTAMSYGRMAQAYPSAGSAFTYVGNEINRNLGFLTGWSMALDYILNPTISIIWCSKAMMNFVPEVHYWIWVILFFLLFTILNLGGIRTSARINYGLAAGMSVVIVIFFIASARIIVGHPHGGGNFFIRPFYDPRTFKAGPVLGGTSLAVLTYIGFDGISTLAEEAKNPKRNIMLATVLTCFVIGILSIIEVYAAQLVWPTGRPFPDLDTAFVHVAGFVGGPWFFLVMNLTLLVACMGSGIGSQLAAARLLYGMGRSGALPPCFFARLDVRHHIPRNNVMLVGLMSLMGAFLLSYSLGAEMLNFGALIAFMGVNAAAFLRYYRRASQRRLSKLVFPLLGGLICFALWLNLSWAAKIAGMVWMIVGICFGAYRTRGFRENLINFEPSSDLAN